MMEDIIAYSLMIAIVLAIGFGIIKIRRTLLEKIEKNNREEIERHEKYAEYLRNKERERVKEREALEARLNGTVGKSTYDPITQTVRTAVKDKKTGQTSYVNTAVESSTSTASVRPVSTWSSDPLTTMVIADMLLNHKDVSADTVSWKDDTPTYKETYSKPSTDFGFDDSDSRKSSSSSFSSSDSSSSWSDSSSSSSDSGPSSDW